MSETERSEAEPKDEAEKSPRPAVSGKPDFTERLGEFPSEELRKARLERNEKAAAAKGF